MERYGWGGREGGQAYPNRYPAQKASARENKKTGSEGGYESGERWGGREGDKSTQADTRLVRLVRGGNSTVLETASGAVVVVDREGGGTSPPKPIHS